MKRAISIMLMVVLSLIACGKEKESNFSYLTHRIVELRNGGSDGDGINVLQSPIKVSEDDYFLMGCDNSCAIRNNPTVPREEISENRWMSAAPDLPRKCAGYNYHSGPDGIETFLNDCTVKKYQSFPEEVAWHYIRVKELRAQGMEVEERVETMTKEAKTKPWERMK